MKTISRKQLAAMGGATIKSQPKPDPVGDAAAASAAAAADVRVTAAALAETLATVHSSVNSLKELITSMQQAKPGMRRPVTATIVRDEKGMLEQVVFSEEFEQVH